MAQTRKSTKKTSTKQKSLVDQKKDHDPQGFDQERRWR